MSKKKDSDIPAWISITAILIIGIVVGLVAPRLFGLVKHKLKNATPPASTQPAAHKGAVSKSQSSHKMKLDFYKLLPKFQVVVPKEDKKVQSDHADKPVKKPGAYVLQVASLRDHKRADKLDAQLALLGLDAHIQQVKTDSGEVWNRVRIGPVKNLKHLNQIRKRLATHHYKPLLIQVE